jgi:hypothetical protein
MHGTRNDPVSRWAQAAGDGYRPRTESIVLQSRYHLPARAQTQRCRGLIQIAQPLALVGSRGSAQLQWVDVPMFQIWDRSRFGIVGTF